MEWMIWLMIGIIFIILLTILLLKKKIGWTVVIIILFLPAGVVFTIGGGLLGAIACLVGIIIFIYLLAHFNICFTFVREGTCKAVMSMNAFHTILMAWRGHFMDETYEVCREDHEEESKKKPLPMKGRIIGGLFFYGLWPFKSIHKYTIKWSDGHFREDKEEMRGKEEKLDHISLLPENYVSRITKNETAPPERLQVDFEYLSIIRITNPYNYLFISPANSIETGLVRVDALMREEIAEFSFDAIYALIGKAEVLWEGIDEESPYRENFKKYMKIEEDEEIKVKGISENKLIKETLVKWGLEVAEKGVSLRQVNPSDPEYSEALVKRRKKELEAEAEAETILGSLIPILAKTLGIQIKEMQKLVKKDDSLRDEILSMYRDFRQRQLTPVKDIRFGNTDGSAENKSGSDLRSLIREGIVLWKEMGGGLTPESEKKEKKKENKEEEDIEEDMEKIDKEIEEECAQLEKEHELEKKLKKKT